MAAFWKSRTGRGILALCTLVAIIVAAVVIRTLQVYRSELPSFEQLHNIEPSINTKLYDRQGVLLKEYYSENRALTPFADLPRPLVDMLLANEDRQFYDHWGINLRRLVTVAITNLLNLEIKAGASTVTQQLSRMLFLNQERTFERKVKEALTAIKLERSYSKQEILEMYFNQYYFSRGAYGVAAAARLFFNKSPRELDLNESAILIGLLKAPNINSPINNPDKSIKARNRVLYSYYQVGGITETQYDSLKALPLNVQSGSEKQGLAPYFTETVRQYIIDKYGDSVLYSGGLTVFTTLDADLQRVADRAVSAKIDSLREGLEESGRAFRPGYTMTLPDTVDALGQPIKVSKLIQAAFVAVDNSTGDVISMVGGRSFAESEFNRAVQGLRQPGSSFKPFVYTACIDNGFKPSDIVDDNPIVLDIPGSKEWRPDNFDNKFLGPITVRDALRLSRNLASIRLLLKVTPEQVIYYAQKLGISTPLQAVPSLAVGVSEVRLVELVSAISVFPNGGVRTPYRMVLKIIDRYGRVLEDNTAVRRLEVLSPQTAYVMTDLLRSVVDSGTGARARWMGFTRPAGGKTGTSNNFCDNWFVGFTPQITAGVWVGFDDKTSLGGGEDGARNAVPIWTQYMIAAHDTLPMEGFEEPDGIAHLEICPESGELATDRCPKVREEIFAEQHQPTAYCHIHPSRGYYRQMERRRQDQGDTTDRRGHF